MYDELVKALRGCVLSKPCDACLYYDPNGPTKECETMNIAAADAIEKLSMKLHGDEATIAGMKREIERMVVADKPRWIPVTERLPDKRKWVLCRCEANIIEVLRLENNEWYHDPMHVYYPSFVTHWMPLPKPPKDGAE